MRSDLSYQDIIRLILSWEGYTLDEARVKSRKRERVLARQIAFYFAKSMTNNTTLAVVGAYLGKDHATVLHAMKTVNNLIDTDKTLRAKIWNYDMRLRNHRPKPIGMPFKLRIWRLTKYAYRNVLDSRDIASQATTLSEEAIMKHIDRLVHFNKFYKR